MELSDVKKLLEKSEVVEELQARARVRLNELLDDGGESTQDGTLTQYLVLLLRQRSSFAEVRAAMQELLQDDHITGE
jgi:hypothetical protein